MSELPEYPSMDDFKTLKSKVQALSERLELIEQCQWVRKIECGTVSWDYKKELDTDFDNVSRGKERHKKVKFASPFASLPKVVIALQDFYSCNKWDNAEMRFAIHDVTKEGFSITYKPTDETRSRWWTVNWIAYESKQASK